MSRGYHIPCTPYLYLVPDSGAAAGMDCLPLQRSPGPFHYLIHEQAKSLVALQELQNEVGALLEFRDLVMETFPHLRTKMAAASSSSSQPPPSNIPVPLARSREWEPGVRVRRRLQPHGANKQQDSDTPSVTSLASRGRGGGKAPKSDGGGSAVQDSGFGTETSSSTSKETSSGVGAPKSCAGGGACAPDEEAEDELWNLLDVIHRKGTRLRDEVEILQLRLKDGEDLRRHSLDEAAATGRRWRRDENKERRCESLGLLLDKVAAAEAEAAQLRAELAELRAAKRDLQQQLRVASGVMPPTGSPGRRLGALDGIVSSPSRLRQVSREVAPDPAKVHAILRELDPVELQRHLLTTSVEKQALEQRLEKSERSHADLLEQLDKVKDENEDLRFQLEEKSIELEGTRARVRVLERLHHKSSLDGPSLLPPAPTTILPLLALPMPVEDPVQQQHHHSSSTESAHDQIIDTESKKSSEVPSSPRRRPSKIPLPGSKNCATPKPPSGKSGRSKDSSLSRSRFDSSSSLSGKNAKESSWKNRSDSSSSLSTSGKSKESPLGRNSSLSSKNNKDSLNGVKSRESLSGKNRVDSLSKRSNTDSLSSGKMKDASFSSTMSGSNKRDSVSGKKDSSFPSSGSRKSLHHQLSTRRSSNTNSSRANLIDQGDQNSKVRPTKLSFWSNWLKILDNGPS